MSQLLRRIQLPLVGALLFCLLVGIYLVAWKRLAKPEPADIIVKHSVDTPPDEVLQYWTVDKMRHAKPAELPNVDVPDQGKQHAQRPPHKSHPA